MKEILNALDELYGPARFKLNLHDFNTISIYESSLYSDPFFSIELKSEGSPILPWLQIPKHVAAVKQTHLHFKVSHPDYCKLDLNLTSASVLLGDEAYHCFSIASEPSRYSQ